MGHVLLPELGEGIEKATVACWHAAVGSRVSQDDDIVEVVTDKATFNVPAGIAGIVREIRVPAGGDATIGEVLAVIEAFSATQDRIQ